MQIVVAIGGNSLVADAQHQAIVDQYAALIATCRPLVELRAAGHDLVITHGNGPQVGFMLRRSELSRHELHEVPLSVCVADTQGGIGYLLQQAMSSALAERGERAEIASVVTQVVVSPDDPAFDTPTKPIGSTMDSLTAKRRVADEGWSVAETGPGAFRRVVPSPEPLEIIELDAIKALVTAGVITIAVGGGGIPVVELEDGRHEGVEAVIDKDRASALLAKSLGADALLISTAVDRVYLDFRTPNQRALDVVTLSDAEALAADGHFGVGSMAPKVEACVDFVRATGGQAWITDPAHLLDAVDGRAGTRFVA